MFKNVHRNGRIDHANIEAAIHRCPTEYQDPAFWNFMKTGFIASATCEFYYIFQFLLFKEHVWLTASSE